MLVRAIDIDQKGAARFLLGGEGDDAIRIGARMQGEIRGPSARNANCPIKAWAEQHVCRNRVESCARTFLTRRED